MLNLPHFLDNGGKELLSLVGAKATLNPYLSASPRSLEILQRLQAEEDARFEQFKAENPDLGFGESEWDRKVWMK